MNQNNMGASIVDAEQKIVRFSVVALHKKKVGLVLKIKNWKKEFPLFERQPHLYTNTVALKEIAGFKNNTSFDHDSVDLFYQFTLDGESYPDPYSHYQPDGVHGFSQLVDQKKYVWNDDGWTGRKQEELIVMEIHTGTFSESGTFQGIIDKLDYLRKLGVNTIELMPVNETPGRWNWGYDGTGLFSINHNYGTPDDLKKLADLCHQKKIGVILDVVYNHFGPEGNYLADYGPYFTNTHRTPWGPAVNYDDKHCAYTRKMVLDNACYWLENYHLDGLRLDAVQTIKDNNTPHILQEIAETVQETAKKQRKEIQLIAETDQNDVKLITPPELGGYGISAQWMDDFHHCIHTTLTGEDEGYYMDYGRITDFEKVFKNYLYTGEYSRYLKKERGTNAGENPGKQFVVCIQNHDQVGNRARGDRLSTLVEFSYLKLAAGLMFISPYIPLLFMGEEYGEENPFLFFTDYQDSILQKAVSEGRKKEFKNFTWKDVPDPQNEETFYQSKLRREDDWEEKNYKLFNFYRALIKLRTTHPVLRELNKKNLQVTVDEECKLLKITRWNKDIMLTAYFNLGTQPVSIADPTGQEIFNSNSNSYEIEGQYKKNTPMPKDNTSDLQTIQRGQMILFEKRIIKTRPR